MEQVNIALEPLRVFLHQLGEFVPKLVLAVIIAVVGWLIAKAVRLAVIKALRSINFHVLTERAGMDGSLPTTLVTDALVVRAEADPHPVIEHDHNRLDFARRIRPEHFEPPGLHHVVDGVAIEHRHRRRPRHADLGQFLDVMAQRRLVAAGPAGDDQRVGFDGDLIGPVREVPRE